MPLMIVCPLSSSVRTVKVGSSSASLPSAMPSLSRSFCVLGSDGQTDHRLGEGHLLEHDRRILGAERIARADLLETDGGADVARNDRLDRVLLVGVHLVHTADTLALAAARVEHVGTGIQFSRIDAHERQTAHEGVGSDLERQTAERIRPPKRGARFPRRSWG